MIALLILLILSAPYWGWGSLLSNLLITLSSSGLVLLALGVFGDWRQ